MNEEEKPKKREFDPDLLPSNPANVEAAKQQRLRYDRRRQVYVDNDGCPIRDRFGQPL